MIDRDLIKETARNLRRRSTKAEDIFREAVRNRQIKNRKFYRQHPIEIEENDQIRFFVADFYCFECKLVIELDGPVHERRKDYDELRTLAINMLGIQVIRFMNDEIEEDLLKIIEKLNTYI